MAWKLEPLEALEAEGIRPATMYAAIAGVSQKRRARAKSWDYFVPAIREAAALDRPPSSGAKAAGVWVKAESDEGRAWEAYLRGRGDPAPTWIESGRLGRGRQMPSPLPPNGAV